MQLGSTMAARHISMLLTITTGVTAILGKAPTIGPTYYHGTLKAPSAPVLDIGTVRIQSTSTASQAPNCNSDVSCQVLCPTDDIPAQQPALSTAAVQQQVTAIASQCRASFPGLSVKYCGHAYQLAPPGVEAPFSTVLA